jgi:4-amino-4-deoxy-L-arabinose transferase-like glycosyltransferase
LQRFLLAKRTGFILLAAVCAAYFYSLGGVPLLGPDEPRYAQVAREMYLRGDWLTPTLAGHTWFEKPALLYWLMIVSYRLFGVTEFAARAGSALAGVLTVVVTCLTARRAEFESGETLRGFAVACACVTASTLGLIIFARAASFDMLLTATVTACLAFFYLSEIERNAGRRRWLLAGFYACVGLSLLAKGLVGIVLPFGIVASYFLLRRRWPGLSRIGIFWGVPLSLAVACVWYAPVIARHGWTFVDEFFVQQHFARYVSNKYHHPQPFFFYLPVILIITLPWTFFFVGGVAAQSEINPRADDAATKLRVLALVWVVAPFLFFSASRSKLPGYILPALPGAALLAGFALHKYLCGAGGILTMRLTGVLALLFAAAGALLAFTRLGVHANLPNGLPLGCALAITLPACVAGLVALFLARRRELCALAFAGATLLTVPLIVGCALKSAMRKETMAQEIRLADARGYAEVPVVQLHTVERTVEFYAAGRLAYDASGEPLKFEGARDVSEFVRRNGGRALVIVPVEYVSQLTDELSLATEYVGDNGSLALVFVRQK